jgi:hypothetical protein
MTRLAIARCGTLERTRALGVAGADATPEQRLRTGSQIVLVGWVLFVVAGAVFAKFSDRWRGSTPIAHRALPTVAFDAVACAGTGGVLIVLSAAAAVLPALIRFVRGGGWSTVRWYLLTSLVVTSVVVAASTSTVLWARTLSVDERNGTSLAYEIVLLACAVGVVATLVTLTSSAIKVSRHLVIPRVVLRFLAADAIALTALMAVVASGIAFWWASEARFAPLVLRRGVGNGILFSSDVVPVTLLGVAALITLGMALGIIGCSRVAKSLRASVGSR